MTLDILEKFEAMVTKEYIAYIKSVVPIHEMDSFDGVVALASPSYIKHSEWAKEGRKRGIVLKWSQKGVKIVHDGKTVKQFRNPYGFE